MKAAFRILFVMSLLSILTGCLTRSSAVQASDKLLIGPLLDRLVPADFQGDGEFGEAGQYLTIEIRATGLRRTEKGWTWRSLDYRRTVNIPLFSGLPYTQKGWLKLQPPEVVK